MVAQRGRKTRPHGWIDGCVITSVERKEKNESKEHAATDQKMVDVPQTQFLDGVDDVLVVMQ